MFNEFGGLGIRRIMVRTKVRVVRVKVSAGQPVLIIPDIYMIHSWGQSD